MKKLQEILKDTRGASLILVLAMMLLFLTIGASIITVAAMASNSVHTQMENENVRRYLHGLAGAFTENVTATQMTSGDETDLDFKRNEWYALARMIYEENYTSENPLQAEITDLQISTSAPLWIAEDSPENNTKISIEVKDQQVNTLIAYAPEERVQAFHPNGTPVLDGSGNPVFVITSSEVQEEKSVHGKAIVTFTATYRGRPYRLKAQYLFDGNVRRCVGIPTQGNPNIRHCSNTEAPTCSAELQNGSFLFGKWSLEGYGQ